MFDFRQLDRIERDIKTIMATIASILAAQQQETTDIGLLSTAVTNLLAAFAAGAITPAQAQTILSGIQAGDQTIAGLTTSISNALGTGTTPAASATTAAQAIKTA